MTWKQGFGVLKLRLHLDIGTNNRDACLYPTIICTFGSLFYSVSFTEVGSVCFLLDPQFIINILNFRFDFSFGYRNLFRKLAI